MPGGPSAKRERVQCWSQQQTRIRYETMHLWWLTYDDPPSNEEVQAVKSEKSFLHMERVIIGLVVPDEVEWGGSGLVTYIEGIQR